MDKQLSETNKGLMHLKPIVDYLCHTQRTTEE